MSDLDEVIMKADGFASLVMWIVRARGVLDSLDHVDDDGATSRALKAAHVPYHVEWSGPENDGLDWLMCELSCCTWKIREALKDARAQS